MVRDGRFERVMSYILCGAAGLLFALALVLNLMEIAAEKVEIPSSARSGYAVKRMPVLYDDTIVVNGSDVGINAHNSPVVKRFLEREGSVASTPVWEPDEADVIALAQTLWGECRGCSYIQKAAVCWCIFNRVDSNIFPNTIIEVVSQPSQFFGYRTSFPVDDELYEIAYNCMVDWHNGENRVLGEDFLYFAGNGRINIFRTGWNSGDIWQEE